MFSTETYTLNEGENYDQTCARVTYIRVYVSFRFVTTSRHTRFIITILKSASSIYESPLFSVFTQALDLAESPTTYCLIDREPDG